MKHTCVLKHKESKAHRHYCLQLLRHTLHGWIRHTENRQAKNKTIGGIHLFVFLHFMLQFLLNHISFAFCVAAVALDVWRVSVLEKFWCQWYNVLQSRHIEKDRVQRADLVAQHGSQRLAFSHWRHCIFDCTVKHTIYI